MSECTAEAESASRACKGDDEGRGAPAQAGAALAPDCGIGSRSEGCPLQQAALGTSGDFEARSLRGTPLRDRADSAPLEEAQAPARPRDDSAPAASGGYTLLVSAPPEQQRPGSDDAWPPSAAQRRASEDSNEAGDAHFIRCIARRRHSEPPAEWRPTLDRTPKPSRRQTIGQVLGVAGRRNRRLRSLHRGSLSAALLSRMDQSGRWRSEGTPSSVGNSSFFRPNMSPDRCGRRSSSGSPFSHDSVGSRRSPAGPRLSIGSSMTHRDSMSGRCGSWNLMSPSFGNPDSPTISPVLRLRRVPEHSMDFSGEDFRNFREAVLGNCLCAAMLDNEVLELAQRAELFSFCAGDEVVAADTAGTFFFIVREGRFLLRMSQDASEEEEDAAPQPPLLLGPGDSFGELALVHGGKQRISVVADLAAEGEEAAGSCWGVERGPFVAILKGMAERVYQENLWLLDRVRLFQYLDQRQKRIICKTLVVQLFDPGKRVTVEGLQHTDCMFIVKSGVLEVEIAGRVVTTLHEGDSFGERAWLYGESRSASVTAAEPSAVIVVRRQILEQVLGSSFKDISWRNVIFASLRDYLPERKISSLGHADLKRITDAFLIQRYPPKSDVIRDEEDARGLRFFILLSGEVVVRPPGAAPGEAGLRLSRGSCFGEEYLADMSKPFRHSVENASEEPCELAFLSADAVAALAAPDAGEDVLTHKQKMALIRKVYVFRHLSNHHCHLIANSFRTICRKEGDVVIKEGEMGSQFFVIKSGELLVTIKGQTIRTLGKSDYFGERGLLYDEPRTATVTCQSKEAELLVIDKVVFSHIVEGKMLEHLEDRIKLQQTDLSLSDLKTIQIIGRGTFGVVRLVEHRSRGTQYALKCISRAEAVKNDQQVNLKLEREILLENDHPFIVKVVRTFKDQRYLYFLTELVTGGELYSTMRVIGLLSKPQAQFYIGGLVLALESLHERCIAYRDLKPENVLLDHQGYTKLIDFGCAVKLRGPSHTIVGTPHYMAPEVIFGKGYGLSCDVWSLGVCLYELICGPLPFAAGTEDPMDVFREILLAKLRFPVHATKDRSGVNIMRRLLRRPLEGRIGCGRSGWRAVRKHAYFRDFSFDRLLSRQLEPPLVPEEPTFASEGEYNSEADEAGGEGEGEEVGGTNSGGGAAGGDAGRGGRRGDDREPGDSSSESALSDVSSVLSGCSEPQVGKAKATAATTAAAPPPLLPPGDDWDRDF